jgi:hypothetical protein
MATLTMVWMSELAASAVDLNLWRGYNANEQCVSAWQPKVTARAEQPAAYQASEYCGTCTKDSTWCCKTTEYVKQPHH